MAISALRVSFSTFRNDQRESWRVDIFPERDQCGKFQLYAIFCLIVKGIPSGEIRIMKERPNHRVYVGVLRAMGPENRLNKAFELSEFSRALTKRGLENLHPEMSSSDLNRLFLERMKKARERAE